MPVTRLTAKIDSPANWSIRRSSRNVITIAKPPTSSGSAAATRPRKTQKESSSRIGKANISARARSEVVRLLISSEGDVVAAQAHAAAGQLRAHVIDGRGGAIARRERGQHERLAAVARDELGQVRGRVVERALEAGLAGQQRGHARGLARRRRVAANVAAARHERRHAEVGGLSGGPFDRPQDLLVLGGRVLEVRGFALQDRDDRRAEDGGEQEHDARDDQHPRVERWPASSASRPIIAIRSLRRRSPLIQIIMSDC